MKDNPYQSPAEIDEPPEPDVEDVSTFNLMTACISVGLAVVICVVIIIFGTWY